MRQNIKAVRLLPKGWVTQVENQGNYKLGNLVNAPEYHYLNQCMNMRKTLKYLPIAC